MHNEQGAVAVNWRFRFAFDWGFLTATAGLEWSEVDTTSPSNGLRT